MTAREHIVNFLESDSGSNINNNGSSSNNGGGGGEGDLKIVRTKSKHIPSRKSSIKPAADAYIVSSAADVRLIPRHPEVYDPCDDSFALVDALLADQVHLREQAPSICVEIGCGSGYVVTSLALILGRHGASAQFLATDISLAASEVTTQTLAAHGVAADVVVTDLVSGLERRLNGAVDVLVFNPPYVPTPEEEVGGPGIVASWAGGDRGRVVIDRMLPLVDPLLSAKGWFYLVTLTANNPSEICQRMRAHGFASRIVIQRNTEEESLHVLKFWRETPSESPNGGTSGFHLGTPRSSFKKLVSFFKN